MLRFTAELCDDCANAPEPPPQPGLAPRPEPDECCQGGCAECIFDAYAGALERYREALAAWQARHPGRP